VYSLESLFIDLVFVFGLPMLALLFFLEGMLIGKLLPTDVLLPAAIILFATASQDFILILLLTSFSSTAGQLLLFHLLVKRGSQGLEDISWLERIPEDTLDRAENWFHKRGGYAVMTSNIVPGVRGFLTIPAALDGMDYRVFLVCSFAGTFFLHMVLVGLSAGFAHFVV